MSNAQCPMTTAVMHRPGEDVTGRTSAGVRQADAAHGDLLAEARAGETNKE